MAEVEATRRRGAFGRVVIEAPDVGDPSAPGADPRWAVGPQGVVADPAGRLLDGEVVLIGPPEVEVIELDPVETRIVDLGEIFVVRAISCGALQELVLIGPGDPVVVIDIILDQVA
jgi:hypothetical protein